GQRVGGRAGGRRNHHGDEPRRIGILRRNMRGASERQHRSEKVRDCHSFNESSRHVRYSMRMFASLITLLQSAASSAKKRAASVRVLPTGSICMSRNRASTSGRRNISATSPLIRSASRTGVFGGATRPNQVMPLVVIA